MVPQNVARDACVDRVVALNFGLALWVKRTACHTEIREKGDQHKQEGQLDTERDVNHATGDRGQH